MRTSHCLLVVLLLAVRGAGAAPQTMSLLGVDSAAIADAADALSGEEQSLLAAGLLPQSFAELKAAAASGGVEAAKALYRKGLRGPFQADVGDPKIMLEAARRVHGNPELSRMCANLQRGDIVVETSGPNGDVVTQTTGGPFDHASICTQVRPPEFIEAIGVTGNPKEQAADSVRRSPLAQWSSPDLAYRILRPVAGMSADQRKKAVDRAVAFAESQLGKPYNFTFTDTSKGGVTGSFYCSELTYLAYVSHSGADLNFPLRKSPERDSLMSALTSLLDALEPDDRQQMMRVTFKFFAANPKPDIKHSIAFVVSTLLAHCRLTRDIAATPEGRAKLVAAITRVLQGKALPRATAAARTLQNDHVSGSVMSQIGGVARETVEATEVDIALAADLTDLATNSGVDWFETASAAWTFIGAMLPYAEALLAYERGPKDPFTIAAGDVLDVLAWGRDNAIALMLTGGLGFRPLPVRTHLRIKTDFVSPTDLAWANVVHSDFNVKPGVHLDPLTGNAD